MAKTRGGKIAIAIAIVFLAAFAANALIAIGAALHDAVHVH